MSTEIDNLFPEDGPLDKRPPKEVIRENAGTLQTVARTNTRIGQRAAALLEYAGLEVREGRS